jgi:hypothetical protein
MTNDTTSPQTAAGHLVHNGKAQAGDIVTIDGHRMTVAQAEKLGHITRDGLGYRWVKGPAEGNTP